MKRRAVNRAAGERGVDGNGAGRHFDQVAGEGVGGEAHGGGVELAGGGEVHEELPAVSRGPDWLVLPSRA